MSKTVRVLLDILIIVMAIVLVAIIILPQQKEMKEELKFRRARTNLYTVRAGIERYIFQHSSVNWDPVRHSWSYDISYPTSLEEVTDNIRGVLINPYNEEQADLTIFVAESSLVEGEYPVEVYWDTADAGQWMYSPDPEIAQLWEQSGLEGIPGVLDDSVIISYDPALSKITYSAWESDEKTPNLEFTITENSTLLYLDTVPPEDQAEFSGWLFNTTIASYLVDNIPELPQNFANLGSVKIKFVWPNPPDPEMRRRRMVPRDSAEVEKPYVMISYYEYPLGSFKPAYLVKEDDSDSSWLAQQRGDPGDIALYIAPPKYCLITFDPEGIPVMWLDPGDNKHLLNLWPPE